MSIQGNEATRGSAAPLSCLKEYRPVQALVNSIRQVFPFDLFLSDGKNSVLGGKKSGKQESK